MQAWVSTDTPAPSGTPGGVGDEDTFGLGANGSTPWDQFTANEQLFGVKASFDEDVYTTKLDRSAPDFKDRERRAQKIANEIIGAATSNPHVAEERGVVDDSGVNEENKCVPNLILSVLGQRLKKFLTSDTGPCFENQVHTFLQVHVKVLPPPRHQALVNPHLMPTETVLLPRPIHPKSQSTVRRRLLLLFLLLIRFVGPITEIFKMFNSFVLVSATSRPPSCFP